MSYIERIIGLSDYNSFYVTKKSKNIDKKGAILYCNQYRIPVDNILCIREVPNCPASQKSIITLLEKNPKADNMPLVTEYEYCGSASQWANAVEMAEKTGRTINLFV